MWLEKFLNIINKIFPQRAPSDTYAELSKINPDKFYLENIRSLMNVSRDKAEEIIKEGIREGVFTEGVEILCPDGSVARSIENLAEIPETVECWELHDGDYEPIEYRTAELARSPYYKLAGIR